MDRMEHIETTKQKILADRIDAIEGKLDRMAAEDDTFDRLQRRTEDLERLIDDTATTMSDRLAT
jgi:tetrahydromethanopterin S-methyltransferase subunit G